MASWARGKTGLRVAAVLYLLGGALAMVQRLETNSLPSSIAVQEPFPGSPVNEPGESRTDLDRVLAEMEALLRSAARSWHEAGL